MIILQKNLPSNQKIDNSKHKYISSSVVSNSMNFKNIILKINRINYSVLHQIKYIQDFRRDNPLFASKFLTWKASTMVRPRQMTSLLGRPPTEVSTKLHHRLPEVNCHGQPLKLLNISVYTSTIQ